MSLEDKIAKALLKKHAGYLIATQSDGWFTSIESQLESQEQLEYKRARLLIGDTELECLIAEDGDAQVQGLQGHQSLGPYEAMIFPYQKPRRVAFHMGKVSFPIDMIFVGSDSRVTRIVEDIEPGTPGNWGMPHILAVVEVNGGFCRAHNIEVGSEVGQIESESKTANRHVAVLIKFAAVKGFIPAFYNRKTKKVTITPGFHDIDMLGGEWEKDPSQFVDGFADMNGEFYTRGQMERLYNMSTSEELYQIDNPDDQGMEEHPLYNVQPSDREERGYGYAIPPERTAQSKLTPAFLNVKTGQIVPSPGFHNIDVLTLDQRLTLDDLDCPWELGFIDVTGEFYTRDQAAARVAQETFPSYPRKDINPKMVTPNETRDRFRDRDLVPNQVQNQPHDPANYDEMEGYDQGRTEDQNEGIGPNVRPL